MGKIFFFKKHPNMIRLSVTSSSACVSENDILKLVWRNTKYLTEISLFDILNKASPVFNDDFKECITDMFTFSTFGEACPPMALYKYQKIPQKEAGGIPNEWGIGRSDNG